MVLATPLTWALRKCQLSPTPIPFASLQPVAGENERAETPPLCAVRAYLGIGRGRARHDTEIVVWVVAHLLTLGRMHDGTWSLWVGTHAPKRGSGKDTWWKNWDIAFFK